MQPVKQLIFPLILSVTSSFTYAGDSGLYIGGALGNATLDGPNFGDVDVNQSIDEIDFDSDDTGYKVFANFRLGSLAIEGGYVNFGAPSKNFQSNNAEVELDGFDILAVLNFGLGPVDVYGKFGFFTWDSEVLVNNVKTGSKDGTDPVIGLGAAFQLGSMSIRAEYEQFDLDDIDEVSMFSVGLAFQL